MRLPGLDSLWPSRSRPDDDRGRLPTSTPPGPGPQEPPPMQERSRTTSRPRSLFIPLNLPSIPGSRPGPEATQLPSDAEAVRAQAAGQIESPKTPQFRLGMPALPSARLNLPHLTRTWTIGSNGPQSRPSTARPLPSRSGPTRNTSSSSRPHSRQSDAASQPSDVAEAPGSRDRLRQFAMPQGTEAHQHGGMRPEEGLIQGESGVIEGEGAGREGETPNKFLCCLPATISQRIRSQVLRCFISGVFLIFLLAIYLALSITKSLGNSEFAVLLILVILFATIFFCHGLIRLCMVITRRGGDDDDEDDRRRHRRRLSMADGGGGFALPRRPIRVVLARDEEAAGIESETTKQRPPAYGLWRESVRVDPNRLFWQRNDQAQEGGPAQASSREQTGESSGSAEAPETARPPSYISDDGVGYVVDAVPRTTLPATDAPLPTHPSERGRWDGTRPAW